MAQEISRNEVLIGSEFPKRVIPLIDNAKREIDICVFDWRYYDKNFGSNIQMFNQSIFRAVRRGVNVRAILNYDSIIPILKKEGVKAIQSRDMQLLHVKMLLIDNSCVIIGSHNYTQNAFNFNQEISVILTDENIKSRLKLFFNNIYQ